VVRASARERSPGVDKWLQADMTLPSGATGRITSSMLSPRVLSVGAEVKGTKGVLRVLNPYAPQYFHHVTVRTAAGKHREHRFPRVATYRYQLEAFVAAVRSGAPVQTGTSDAIANMRVIDDAYRAAGMEPRQPSA
jgi:predicted dehydrogenase